MLRFTCPTFRSRSPLDYTTSTTSKRNGRINFRIRTSSSYVDVFYNNALVFRDLYVTVDGGRVSLPLPKRKLDESSSEGKIVALEVPEGYHDFIRLVESLEGSADRFEEYFVRAGMTIVEKLWPEFGSD